MEIVPDIISVTGYSAIALRDCKKPVALCFPNAAAKSISVLRNYDMQPNKEHQMFKKAIAAVLSWYRSG